MSEGDIVSPSRSSISCYVLARRQLRIECSSSDTLKAIDSWMPVYAKCEETSLPTHEAAIVCCEQLPQDRLRRGDIASESRRTRDYFDDRKYTTLVDDIAMIQADSEAKTIVAWVTSAAQPTDMRVVANRVISAWYTLLAEDGLHFLHAACCAGPNGSVLIPGDSHHGKTSTTVGWCPSFAEAGEAGKYPTRCSRSPPS